MKTTTKRLALPMLGLLAATLAFSGSTALAAKIYVPANYPTIQGAVTAAGPGDIIMVSAGTYNESQIVIDKPLKVLGAGADGTIIDGGNVPPPGGVGLVRITAAGNVTLSGFTLRNAGASGGVRVGLFASSPVAGNKYTITDNKIIGSGDSDDDQDYGFYGNGGRENLVFQQNLVKGTGANAVLIELHAGPTDISYNVLDVGVWGADAIFTMTYGGLDVTTIQKRNNNEINVGTGGPFDVDHRAGGITFASAYRNDPYDVDGGDGKFTSVQIMRNTIYNVQAERRGISLWNGDIDGNSLGGNIVSPQVVGNVISGVADHTDGNNGHGNNGHGNNGHGNNGHGNNGHGSKGIQLLGLVSNAKLANNYLADLDIGIHLRNWGGFVPSDTEISNNRFDDVGTRVKIDSDDVGTKNHAAQTAPNAVGTKQRAGHLVAP